MIGKEVLRDLPRKNTYPEPRPRIETLSDLIFGLALSIGALSLVTNPPISISDITVDILSFGFSFLVLISVWILYTAIMSVLPMETRTTTLLNIILLFLVSIEPYVFNLVSLIGHFHSTQIDNFASIVYAFDMGGLMAIMAFFAHALSIEEKGLVSPLQMSRFKDIRNILFISAGLFFISVIPEFWIWTIEGTPIRFYFWLIPLVISWLRRAWIPKKPHR
nr:TMEM175 family protein [Candidatus Freyarchaeota archaeon]